MKIKNRICDEAQEEMADTLLYEKASPKVMAPSLPGSFARWTNIAPSALSGRR